MARMYGSSLTAAFPNKLTRAQMLVVLRAPSRRGVIKELAEAFGTSEDLIRHTRSKCKWMLDKHFKNR